MKCKRLWCGETNRLANRSPTKIIAEHMIIRTNKYEVKKNKKNKVCFRYLNHNCSETDIRKRQLSYNYTLCKVLCAQSFAGCLWHGEWILQPQQHIYGI